MPNPDLQIPAVHLNGSGRQALVSQNLAARSAVRHAIEALAEAAPNQRDYYVLGDDAWKRARDQHVARLQKLESLYAELGELVQGISDAGFR